MIVTITEPSSLAVTAKEAKDHLRVPGNYDDVYVSGLLGAAIKSVEHRTGFKLFTQTIEYRLDSFPHSQTITIPCGKVTAVSSIKYDDTDDVEQTWASSNYWTDLVGNPARVTYKSTVWPTTEYNKPGAVRIRCVAGWTDRHDIPDHFKIAIKLLVGHWYTNREAVTELNLKVLPEGVDAILTGNPEYHFYVL